MSDKVKSKENNNIKVVKEGKLVELTSKPAPHPTPKQPTENK